MNREFFVNIDHVTNARHYKVTLVDVASPSKSINEEFDEIFFKEFNNKDKVDAVLTETPKHKHSEEEIFKTEKLKEDEEELKLGFRSIQITHFKNPSAIYIRNTKLVTFNQFLFSK